MVGQPVNIFNARENGLSMLAWTGKKRGTFLSDSGFDRMIES